MVPNLAAESNTKLIYFQGRKLHFTLACQTGTLAPKGPLR